MTSPRRCQSSLIIHPSVNIGTAIKTASALHGENTRLGIHFKEQRDVRASFHFLRIEINEARDAVCHMGMGASVFKTTSRILSNLGSSTPSFPIPNNECNQPGRVQGSKLDRLAEIRTIHETCVIYSFGCGDIAQQ